MNKFLLIIYLEALSFIGIAFFFWLGMGALALAGVTWAAYIAHPWIIVLAVWLFSGVFSTTLVGREFSDNVRRS